MHACTHAICLPKKFTTTYIISSICLLNSFSVEKRWKKENTFNCPCGKLSQHRTVIQETGMCVRVCVCVCVCMCACKRVLCCIPALHASAHLRASVWNSSTHIPLTIKVKLTLCTAAYPSTSVATHRYHQQSGKATVTKLKLILKGQWGLP